MQLFTTLLNRAITGQNCHFWHAITVDNSWYCLMFYDKKPLFYGQNHHQSACFRAYRDRKSCNNCVKEAHRWADITAADTIGGLWLLRLA